MYRENAMSDEKNVDVTEVISERVFWLKQFKTVTFGLVLMVAIIGGTCAYQTSNTNAMNIQIAAERNCPHK